MSSENNKRIAKNTAMLYIRMMLTMLISLYTSRIVLRILGVEDFGIYNVVGGVVSMFVFLQGALGAATSRFMTFELGRGDTQQLKKVFRTAFTIHILFAVIILLFLETVGLWFVNNKLVIPAERLYAANWIYQFSIFSSIVSIIQIPLTASIIAHERMNIYAWLGIFDVAMKLAMVLLLDYSGFDKLITYGFLLTIISGLVFLIYHLFCQRNFSEYILLFIFEKDLLKEMLHYSGWSFIGSFATIMKLQGINILLNIFFGPAVNAARGIAYQVNNAVNSFTQNFTTAINPQIIKNYANGEIEVMMNLLFRGTKFSYFLLLFLGLPIILEAEFILDLWLVDVPEYAVIFTQLIIINSLLESFTFVLGASIQATGKIKWYQIGVGGFLLLNLPISYWILKVGYPPQATLVVSIVLAFFALILRVVLIKIQIPSLPVKKLFNHVFGVAALVTMVSISVPLGIEHFLALTGWSKFLFIALTGLISTSAAIWFLGLTMNERKFLIALIRK
ncbi:oligosaccharide flippase family protein [Gaoshiqia sediminis]|uniref:Oligosaccharide flippase family protein n=1 Tax=Gaoshiqia sediminis TaxID=2986998 RepID=A0AA41YEA1_9BACT|nr:oligosaccharide flippase family protein [Gaoshiqia sediminis]MCW0484122.1 oligosaccharide flippase family protein [Gaoshiqia sediminis]